MSARPFAERSIAYRWTGEVFKPLPRFAKACAELIAGQVYRLKEDKERSDESHGHYFGCVNTAFDNLPEIYADRFASAEHLRKWCLIKTGFRKEYTYIAETEERAEGVALLAGQLDEYAVIQMDGRIVMRKPRSYGEVYNDLDQEVVNLFRVLQSPLSAEALRTKLRLTPFSRDEFELGYLDCAGDPIERARRLVILCFMGFGSNGHNKATRTGFRANSNRSGTTPAHDWANYPDRLPAIIERLRGVVIENRDALEVMAQHDSRETLHYIDPPYMWETRSSAMHRNRCYTHELDAEDHRRLLAFLVGLDGAVVISGYPHDSYDDALNGWQRIEINAHADGARDRIEVIWLNPKATADIKRASAQQDLFNPPHSASN